jgi:hypothetical protein
MNRKVLIALLWGLALSSVGPATFAADTTDSSKKENRKADEHRDQQGREPVNAKPKHSRHIRIHRRHHEHRNGPAK